MKTKLTIVRHYCTSPAKLFALSVTAWFLTTGAVLSEEAGTDEHMDHSAHAGHQMSSEMMAEIREKISVYQDMSDEQIMADMAMMPNFDVYISEKSVVGDVGILVLTHGFRDPLNAEFEKGVTPVSKKYPTAVSYGMTMMTSAPIQSAVDRLKQAGAKNIVIVPVTTMMHSRMIRQWEYAFNQREEAEYVSVDRIKTGAATVVFTETPTEAPILATIMLDHAREISTDPENEVLILVSHGPTFDADNVVELAILEAHAKRISQMSDFSAVRAITIRDDTRENIRGLNVDKLRSMIEDAIGDGKRAILVTNLVLLPSFHKKLEADLAGLDYQLNSKGVMLHPAMSDWIEQVAETHAKSMQE